LEPFLALIRYNLKYSAGFTEKSHRGHRDFEISREKNLCNPSALPEPALSTVEVTGFAKSAFFSVNSSAESTEKSQKFTAEDAESAEITQVFLCVLRALCGKMPFFQCRLQLVSKNRGE